MKNYAFISCFFYLSIVFASSCGFKATLTESAKVEAGGGTGGSPTTLGAPQLVTVADPAIPTRPALNTQFIDVSGDGRFLVFDAADVVGSSPTGGRRRIFFTDLQTAQTQLVSRTQDSGDVEDCDSTDATISSDGSTIAFVSCSSNLDLSSGTITSGVPTLVIMDRATGDLEAAVSSVSSGNGYQSIAISGDGDRIAFVANNDLVSADTNGTADAYVYERGVGVRLVSQSTTGVVANGPASMVHISDDGNHVIFTSAGTNLDPTVTLYGGNSGLPQPYVHDLLSGVTRKISAPVQTSFEAHTPSISADGQYVAFVSSSDEFRSGFNHGDTDGVNKVYLRDLDTGRVVLVSTNASGVPANGPTDNSLISPDGRFVFFASEATNLVPGDANSHTDVFVKDLQTQAVELMSINSAGQQADQGSSVADTTQDAKLVLFSSLASNLVAGDTNYQNTGVGWFPYLGLDVFVRDRESETTTRVSLADDESEGDGNSFGLSISSDGRYVLFVSGSTNLIADAHPGGGHLFLRDTIAGTTTLVAEKLGGGYPNFGTEFGSMSDDASVIAFASRATDIVAGDVNGVQEIFIKRLGTTYRILGLAGMETDNDSSNPIVSADGSKVLFRSTATNLVPNDINAAEDWFIYDVNSGAVTLASTDQLGYQLSGVDSNSSAALSASGEFIVYGHTPNSGVRQLSWRRVPVSPQTGDLAQVIPVTETRIKADIGQDVTKLRISNGGEYAFIETKATNVVSGSNSNGERDVFRFDLRKSYFQLLLHSFDPQSTNNLNQIQGSLLGDISSDGKTYQITSLKLSPFDVSYSGGDNPTYLITEGSNGARSFDLINVDGSSVPFHLNPQTMVMDAFSQSFFITSELIPGLTNDFGYLLYQKTPSGVSPIDLPAPQYDSANSFAFGIRLSPDGNRVSFASGARNLHPLSNGNIQAYIRDMNATQVELISQNTGAPASNGVSGISDFSSDGRSVVFASSSLNLMSGLNGQTQILLKNLDTSATQIVSVNSSGAQGNGQSQEPRMDASEKIVVFSSHATNLVAGDTNGQVDVFLRNLETNTTARLSESSSGNQANATSFNVDVSADGRYVVFESYASNLVPNDTNGYPDIFLRDTVSNTTTIVSVSQSGTIGNSSSTSPRISADGRLILFMSAASNLIAGDTNGSADVFVHDRISGETTLVSVGDQGQQGNDTVPQRAEFSKDGRYVVFISRATNLISGSNTPPGQVYVRDRQASKTFLVSKSSGSSFVKNANDVAISDDGSAVAFDGDYLDVGKVIGVGPQIFWRKIR